MGPRRWATISIAAIVGFLLSAALTDLWYLRCAAAMLCGWLGSSLQVEIIVRAFLLAPAGGRIPRDAPAVVRTFDEHLRIARVALESLRPRTRKWEATRRKFCDSVAVAATSASRAGYGNYGRRVADMRAGVSGLPPGAEDAWREIIKVARDGLAAGEHASLLQSRDS
jgi:hypothetical protein